MVVPKNVPQLTTEQYQELLLSRSVLKAEVLTITSDAAYLQVLKTDGLQLLAITDLPTTQLVKINSPLDVSGNVNVAVSAGSVGAQGIDSVSGILTGVNAGLITTPPPATDEALSVRGVQWGFDTDGVTLRNLLVSLTIPTVNAQGTYVKTVYHSPFPKAGGVAIAPGALAVIATATPGTGGTYEIYAFASMALGVPVAGDEANMALYVTGTQQARLPYTDKTGGPFGPYYLTASAADTINIRAVAAATAGVSYVAGFTGKRVA